MLKKRRGSCEVRPNAPFCHYDLTCLPSHTTPRTALREVACQGSLSRSPLLRTRSSGGGLGQEGWGRPAAQMPTGTFIIDHAGKVAPNPIHLGGVVCVWQPDRQRIELHERCLKHLAPEIRPAARGGS